MVVEIRVRGEAEEHFRAERATVTVDAAVENRDKQKAFDDAVAIQEPLASQLRELADRGAVTTWSSDQVRVYTSRPWIDGLRRGAPVHAARLQVTAEFVDFERLSGFLDYWSGRDHVEIAGIAWDLLPRNRRGYEAEVRRAAVDNAVNKAQAYSDAVRRGRVTPTRLADPGMLESADGARPEVFAVRADLAAGAGGGAELQLTPGDIVIRVQVDAEFVTD